MTSKDVLKLAVALVLVASAENSFAVSTLTGPVAMGQSGTFAPSASVTIHIAADNVAYAADASHSAGSRVYYGNYSDPKIWYSTKDAGATPTIVGNPTVTIDTSAWSSL